MKTVITVPDQSLSVRDILRRFQSGSIDIPDLDVGADDDIDADLDQFEDIVDAMDSIETSKSRLRKRDIKKSELGSETEVKEHSDTTKVEDPNKD